MHLPDDDLDNPPPDARPTPVAALPGLPPLPVPLTTFVGREEVAAAVVARLRAPETRLLTLTGPGGVGKSRLALKIADELRPAFPDGVGFIGLAEVTDPGLVLPAISHRLGIREGDRRSLMQRVAAHLGHRRCLLVLDNFEQVTAAGPVLIELLGACPSLVLLVTSRAPLHVSGEQVIPTPPLTLPVPGAGAEVVESEAVRLFIARASSVTPGITLTELTAPAIAEICMRLDGLPLAIELAAVRSSLFTPPVMLARLEQRLPMLTGGPQDQPARLKTMADAIRWSYDLLTDDEQALFRRLSIFVGGVTLPGTAAISDEGESTVLASLAALIDHSLVQAVADLIGEPRYVMLETIREFGRDQLVVTDEIDGAQERHAWYFVELAERIEPDVDGPEAPAALALLDRDRANLQAALAWLIERQETDGAVRLAAALWRYWRIRGYLSEGREGLARALELPGPASSPVRAEALWKLGYMLFFLGESDAARDHLEQSVTLFASAGDRAGEATALDSLGTVLLILHDLQRARACHERALAMRQALGERFESGVTLANLARIALHRGENGEARALLEEALAIARDSGSRRELAHRCLNLSQVELAEQNPAAARELLERALGIFEEIGDQVAIADALELLGQVTSELGEREHGAGLIVASLQLRLKLGLQRNLAECIERLAIAATQLDPARATRLLAAATAERKTTGGIRLPWDEADWGRAIAAARAALDDERFDAEWRAGASLSIFAAADEARTGLAKSIPARDHRSLTTPGPLDGVLTPRELEILRLVAAGHTNRSIADLLFISPATVKRHVTNILAKLGVPTRAAAISYALRAGILDDTP